MLEEPIIFVIIFIVSLTLKYLYNKGQFGYLNPLFLRLFYVGVIIHELAHYLMCKIVGVETRGIRIAWRSQGTGERNPHGAVGTHPPSFVQAIFIGLAPLYVGTWLIFLTLATALNSDFNIYIRVISGLICFSILAAAAPSSQDFNNIPAAFSDSPANSWYQVLLLFLSGVTMWIILINIQVVFLLDVFFYLTFIAIYFMFKFSFIGIKKIILSLKSRNFKNPRESKIRPFLRRRYKPKKPVRLR